VDVMVEPMLAEEPGMEKDSARLKIVERSWDVEEGQKKLNIHMEMEKGSNLKVSTYQGEKLVNEETFEIDTDEFTYPFIPGPEESRLVFSVTDPQERTGEESIVISHQPFDPGLEKLMGRMNQYSGDALIQRLRELEEQELTTGEFLQALIDTDLPSAVPPAHLDALLYSLMLLSPDTPAQFMEKLKNLASGNLKEYLEHLDQEGFETKEELIQQLRAAAGKPLYTKEDLRNLFTAYLDQAYDPQKLQQLALELAGIHIPELIASMGDEASHIVSTNDLLDYLREEKPKDSPKIIARIRGIELSGVETGTSTRDVMEALEKQQEPGPRSRIIYIIGGLALLILLLLMFRRRKQKNRNQN
jgi:LPXTG-motif cell wall-anchored protein